ncbi:MAG: tyrosine-protein phosphatase [Ruminococcaceae bacterium]|nr:tyrosine-protein phosphatase [Oscillospiraceae bacterium]
MKSLVNFRDLGGAKGYNGLKVKGKRLLRSAQVSGLSAEDRKNLKEVYDLKIIVDFRTETEIIRKPNDTMPEFEYVNINLREKNEKRDIAVVAPGERTFSFAKTPDDVVEHMVKEYAWLISEAVSLNGFRKFFDILQDNKSGSVLFHCYAGKDRTGIAAAIVYSLLGVSDDDIFEDYILSNFLRKNENERVVNQAREEEKSREFLEVLTAVMRVDFRYIGKAFDIAREKEGSFFNYVKKALFINDKELSEFRKNYLTER